MKFTFFLLIDFIFQTQTFQKDGMTAEQLANTLRYVNIANLLSSLRRVSYNTNVTTNKLSLTNSLVLPRYHSISYFFNWTLTLSSLLIQISFAHCNSLSFTVLKFAALHFSVHNIAETWCYLLEQWDILYDSKQNI